METQKHLSKLLLVMIVTLAIIAAGCGGGMALTYRVTGTTQEADITFTQADGEIETITTDLPWQKTLTVGREFSFELEALNPSGNGTVTCEALADEKSLGEGTGNASINCYGSVSKSRNSLSASFSSAPNVAAPTPTATPDTSLAETVAPSPTATLSSSDHVELGIEYAEKDELQKAIAEFERAIELDPNNADAYRNLGTVTYRSGRAEDAMTAYEQAVELNPNHGEAYGDLTWVYIELGKLPEAIVAGEKAVELAPDYAAAHNNLGIAYARQDRIEEAIGEYQEAIRLNPNDADAHKNLGNAYLSQDLLDDAIDAYQEAIRIEPEYAGAHKNLGIAYLKQDRIEEAITEFETYLIWPKSLATNSFDLNDDAPPEVYLQAMVDRLEAEILEMGNGPIDGYPAAFAATSGNLEGTPYRGEFVTILVEERFFLVEALAPPDQWDDVRPTFVKMMDSLSFFEPEP